MGGGGVPMMVVSYSEGCVGRRDEGCEGAATGGGGGGGWDDGERGGKGEAVAVLRDGEGGL